MFRTRRLPIWPLAALLVLALPACVDEDEPAVGEPTLDAQFVGYSNPQTRQTTCGNCHISKQRDWVRTAHAHAWQTLQASGHAAPMCNSCHTTSGFGNTAPDSTGFFAVSADARQYYYDVQCESCHGPGAGHVTAPDDAQPLTTIFADTGATVGCATCHAGSHHPFVEQWRQSLHGQVRTSAASRPIADGCPNCHEGRQIVMRLDPEARFIEQSQTTLQPITCAACHDPHGGPNAGQLRLPVDVPDLDRNLCMNCHNRRAVPDPTSSRGPHAPHGAMLLGEAGWIPENFAYEAARTAATHGTAANPRLCAGCHMETFTVNDRTTGAFVMSSVGHLFSAIPCVDSTGVPTGSHDCADSQRRFNACATSGCHSSGAIAASLRSVLRGRLESYVRRLWVDVDNDGLLDPFPSDSGLLARVRATSPGDFSATGAGATIVTVGEGVFFNVDLVKRADGSWGVHNPFYAEALLLASEDALRRNYSYLPPAPPALQAQVESRMQALGMARR